MTTDQATSSSIAGSATAAEARKTASSAVPDVANEKTAADSNDNAVTGRTPDGTTFIVPQTSDMVTNLLDPRVKKSVSDMAIVSILASYIFIYLITPQSFRIPVFVLMFGCWRMAYNVGIGWLLSQQSNYKRLTRWAEEYKVFEKGTDTTLANLIKQDLEAKMDPKTYDFYKTPLEFNTWLVFRDVVDLILMSDFTCYVLLALSAGSLPDQSKILIAGRWIAGTILILFNLWVKLDAHRVVRDYAWYWGDFFFLEDLELTFDGVFEMAPHPMYSIGYAGFYGISLISASYTLFACSVIAHACQFAFLIIVENPHIDKTYNPPQPRKKPVAATSSSTSSPSLNGESAAAAIDGTVTPADNNTPDENAIMRSSRSAMLVFKNFNITRITDVAVILMAGYCSLLYFLPQNSFWFLVTFFSALGWRLFHNFGIGFLLHKQSENKLWTRLFLKYGKTSLDAYEQWQALYNASTVMSYVSFGVFALRQWVSPSGVVPYWPFRYILGGMLISLQVWTSYSIYETLGEYGWFFGDFFFPKPQKLTYSGIYRYLNNPERLFGIAGVWGMALLTSSTTVTILAFVWTYAGMAFISFVEQPHMQKLYGDQLRQEAGVTKTIKQAAKLSPPIESSVRRLQGSIDKVFSETADAVENFLGQAKPKILSSNVKEVVNDTKVLLKQYPARLTIVRVSDEINVDPSKYGLEIKTSNNATSGSDDKLKFEFGTPIHINWTSDNNRTNTDWIGLYRLTDNGSTEVTRISSRGRWVGLDKDGYLEDHTSGIVSTSEDKTSGEVVFKGDSLFWEKGVYELRYHYNGKHNVLAISKPFEIITTPIEIDSNDKEQIIPSLLSLVQRCCGGTDLWAPNTAEDPWDLGDDDKVVSRLSYGVKEIYGVDLAPSVFVTDQNVQQLASRLVNVKNALKPFIMVADGNKKDE